ncbi:putative basic amino acid antiporter YfcC [Flammeovirga yaeyamensis]|uniref:Basic amino acid antiporter YfcC n=1 Tax=Flammeovirga yaeyamensis TaxID=367791 RepID=A0AAX1N994_9BACT|nr:putative basic amino acid antiporter YfcC [Flammeovirga yaeyamensis]MBB3699464.1 putative ion transporter superfamily protein YfcC [Flammeovirga yaeyamensis]NMF35279.1 putative basic amino acid antiporter YfcC [Flammeovirga yaeyamensis]QWG04139.1 putative basic amino acid antiporter YfcC [Flammeovirga yaeyamensis]
MKKLPDTLVISSTILAFFIGLTWIISAGEYQREMVDGRNLLIPNTYHKVEAQPQSIASFFTAPINGFVSAAEIIAFIFIVGGAFGMLTQTNAIEAGLQRLVLWSNKKKSYKKILIPFIFVCFSVAGATFGMSEEVLIFILITIPMAKAMKLDTIVGVAIPFVGAGVGFAGAISNPFTIGIAQGIAEIPLFSGWEYRVFVWSVFTLIGMIYVMYYVSKIENNKEKSLLPNQEKPLDVQEKSIDFNYKKAIVVALLFIGIGVLVVGVTKFDWYMTEIGALFFVIGFIASLICRTPANKMSESFIKGSKEMMTAALVIASCKGILIVATEGKIIDTILFSITGLLDGLPKFAAAEAMFVFQSILNTVLPSGSGQAALTMPIMAPLSDLLGISRQVAVLAFQFGDGLTNLIIPTSGVTMGVLSIAKIPYNVWVKWMAPLLLLLMFAAGILLIGPLYFNLL